MKLCKYCNGTGRRIQKRKGVEGSVKFYGIECGDHHAVNEKCPKCYGKGFKAK